MAFFTCQISDNEKFECIRHRIPDKSFNYTPKQYKDSRRKSGFISCRRDWLEKLSFLCYSKICDGVFCLACVLFPDSSHRVAKQLISEPCQDCKEILKDIKNHAFTEYHLSSMARLNEFMRTSNNPEKDIGVTISRKNKEKFEENREFLMSIIKCLEFFGRQGIGLRGHRDDNTTSSFNNGNFKEMFKCRANSGDNTLRKHLDAGKRNAMYTSKTTQNDLLECIKEFIQINIYEQVASQSHGPLFGVQINKVTDSANIEQLGVIM